jgi:hypothetical protein
MEAATFPEADDVSGVVPDPNSLAQAIADLEAVDARLSATSAAHPSAEAGSTDPAAAIGEGRRMIRAAIKLLSDAQAADQPAGGGKRRVKMKAASENAEPASAATAKSAPKAVRPAGKNARGERAAAVGTGTGAEAARPPVGSLLARLGAASNGAAAPPAGPDSDTATAVAHAITRDPSIITAEDASARLARLEAEIASLTDASVSGTAHGLARTAATPPSPAPVEAAPSAVAREATVGPANERESAGDVAEADDAEIVIVTRDGARAVPSEPSGAEVSRQGRRIHLGDPAPGEEDAEVEIVQADADGKLRRPAAPERAVRSVSTDTPGRAGRWRLFRSG